MAVRADGTLSGRRLEPEVPAGLGNVVAGALGAVVADAHGDADAPKALTEPALSRLIGKQAPELETGPRKNSRPLALAELRGKYVLLDFWGPWCGPCVRDVPALVEQENVGVPRRDTK